jgi:hypothetical protein
MEPNPNPTPPPETTLEKPKRPAYLGWLAGYLAIYGGVLLALQLFAYKNLQESGVSMDYSPLLLLVSIIFLGVLGITAGAGLWWGKKWGWWLSAFYFLYAFSRELNILVNPASAGMETTRSWLSAGLGIISWCCCTSTARRSWLTIISKNFPAGYPCCSCWRLPPW